MTTSGAVVAHLLEHRAPLRAEAVPGADGARPATGVELLGGALGKPPWSSHESQADRSAQPLGELPEHVPADVGGRSTLDGGGPRDAGQGDHGAPVGVDEVGGAHRGHEPAAASLVEATDVQRVHQPGALGAHRQGDDAVHRLRGAGVQHPEGADGHVVGVDRIGVAAPRQKHQAHHNPHYPCRSSFAVPTADVLDRSTRRGGFGHAPAAHARTRPSHHGDGSPWRLEVSAGQLTLRATV